MEHTAQRVRRLGIELDDWPHRYGSKDNGYRASIAPTATWLTVEDLQRAFGAVGDEGD